MKVGLLLAAVAAGASAQPLGFEVASIKPADPARPIAIRRSGDRISTTSTSLQFLITWAYDIHAERVYGKPGWLDTARYDVLANGPEGRTPGPRPFGQPGALQEMMQTLLAERFKLKVHRETRELPLYVLTAAKGGPKVKLSEMPAAIGQSPFSMPAPGRLVGTQVTAAMLAKVLGDQLGRTVRDETGLQGVFDFTLQWEPEMEGGVSLFTAIQEQLGLKLEGRKGPVEVLVIDHAESVPAEN